MNKKKILYICGTINQTTQMHSISKELPEYDAYFTPFYSDGIEELLRQLKLTEMTVMGFKIRNKSYRYLRKNKLKVDYKGVQNNYDLVLTCSDLIIQKNIRDKKIILVQEGMIDPINVMFYVVKELKFLPHWLAGTSVAGLNDYYTYFCVASNGFREELIRRGVNPNKIRITGIPNFDNCKKYYDNQFPYRDFVLVCTSDLREKYRYENRRRFIERALQIAGGRQLIFKLHPNENVERAKKEIQKYAPEALVYDSGSAEEMIANSRALITRYSSTILVAAALQKDVYSDVDMDTLKKWSPIQNANAAANIADVCREVLENTEDVEDMNVLESSNDM